jgi:uncharacterized protein (TIGR03118 family)
MNILYKGGALLLATAALCSSHGSARASDCPNGGGSGNDFEQTNLVSDDRDMFGTPFEDARLKNPWGLVTTPAGRLWTANNHTSLGTIYDSNGSPFPSPANPFAFTTPDDPTGLVQNPTSSFVVKVGSLSAPATFILVTEGVVVAAWAPQVNPGAAVQVASVEDAVFKGLALLDGAPLSRRLFVADFFHRQVDVFNGAFQLLKKIDNPCPPFQGTHPRSPFNVAVLLNHLYVACAEQDPSSFADELAGPGTGAIVRFSLVNSNPVNPITLDVGATADAPWAMVIAPPGFGPFGNALIVGNFGSGFINAYNPATGAFLGRLRDEGGPLHIDGLWGLEFGKALGLTRTLFFAAGPGEEEHGLVGRIDPGL